MQPVLYLAIWVWLETKELGSTAGFSLWFQLPRCHVGLHFLVANSIWLLALLCFRSVFLSASKGTSWVSVPNLHRWILEISKGEVVGGASPIFPFFPQSPAWFHGNCSLWHPVYHINHSEFCYFVQHTLSHVQSMLLAEAHLSSISSSHGPAVRSIARVTRFALCCFSLLSART